MHINIKTWPQRILFLIQFAVLLTLPITIPHVSSYIHTKAYWFGYNNGKIDARVGLKKPRAVDAVDIVTRRRSSAGTVTLMHSIIYAEDPAIPKSVVINQAMFGAWSLSSPQRYLNNILRFKYQINQSPRATASEI